MTSQEMMRQTCKPGYWFVNIAPIGNEPNWQQQPVPLNRDGKLFGYDEKQFLQRQYK